jgi:hypothetical protein
MAIVGPNYKFICARIGGYGTNSNWRGGQYVMGSKFEGTKL